MNSITEKTTEKVYKQCKELLLISETVFYYHFSLKAMELDFVWSLDLETQIRFMRNKTLI